MKQKTLIFTRYYYPSYKAGGPVTTLRNMCNMLSQHYDLYIITTNKDIDGSKYNLTSNIWQEQDGVIVCYLEKQNINIKTYKMLVGKLKPDLIYLNSFFDVKFSIMPIIGYKLGFFKNIPILLAPRGEFSEGGLSIKSTKKKIFLFLAKFFRLHKAVIWHASTEMEASDINSYFINKNTLIAKDLPSVRECVKKNQSNNIRGVFISRISPMKNLLMVLDILKQIQSKLTFDIYGPIEDKAYWQRCKKKIKGLPNNINVNYRGELIPYEVQKTFARYDFFLFPTLGENYGHVIAESLLAGTYVIISDQTPWLNIEEYNVGKIIRNSEPHEYVREVESLSILSVEKRANISKKVLEYAEKNIPCRQDIEENTELFRKAIKIKI